MAVWPPWAVQSCYLWNKLISCLVFMWHSYWLLTETRLGCLWFHWSWRFSPTWYEALLGHAAPACLFPSNLFDTELLLGSGRTQGRAGCDRTACDRADHALSFWVTVLQGSRNRMQSLASRLFESQLFFKDSDSWLTRAFVAGLGVVIQCAHGEPSAAFSTLSLELWLEKDHWIIFPP